eukprot:6357947-Amphidinium_carterae.4
MIAKHVGTQVHWLDFTWVFPDVALEYSAHFPNLLSHAGSDVSLLLSSVDVDQLASDGHLRSPGICIGITDLWKHGLSKLTTDHPEFVLSLVRSAQRLLPDAVFNAVELHTQQTEYALSSMHAEKDSSMFVLPQRSSESSRIWIESELGTDILEFNGGRKTGSWLPFDRVIYCPRPVLYEMHLDDIQIVAVFYTSKVAPSSVQRDLLCALHFPCPEDSTPASSSRGVVVSSAHSSAASLPIGAPTGNRKRLRTSLELPFASRPQSHFEEATPVPNPTTFEDWVTAKIAFLEQQQTEILSLLRTSIAATSPSRRDGRSSEASLENAPWRQGGGGPFLERHKRLLRNQGSGLFLERHNRLIQRQRNDTMADVHSQQYFYVDGTTSPTVLRAQLQAASEWIPYFPLASGSSSQASRHSPSPCCFIVVKLVNLSTVAFKFRVQDHATIEIVHQTAQCVLGRALSMPYAVGNQRGRIFLTPLHPCCTAGVSPVLSCEELLPSVENCGSCTPSLAARCYWDHFHCAPPSSTPDRVLLTMAKLEFDDIQVALMHVINIRAGQGLHNLELLDTPCRIYAIRALHGRFEDYRVYTMMTSRRQTIAHFQRQLARHLRIAFDRFVFYKKLCFYKNNDPALISTRMVKVGSDLSITSLHHIYVEILARGRQPVDAPVELQDSEPQWLQGGGPFARRHKALCRRLRCVQQQHSFVVTCGKAKPEEFKYSARLSSRDVIAMYASRKRIGRQYLKLTIPAAEGTHAPRAVTFDDEPIFADWNQQSLKITNARYAILGGHAERKRLEVITDSLVDRCTIPDTPHHVEVDSMPVRIQKCAERMLGKASSSRSAGMPPPPLPLPDRRRSQQSGQSASSGSRCGSQSGSAIVENPVKIRLVCEAVVPFRSTLGQSLQRVREALIPDRCVFSVVPGTLIVQLKIDATSEPPAPPSLVRGAGKSYRVQQDTVAKNALCFVTSDLKKTNCPSVNIALLRSVLLNDQKCALATFRARSPHQRLTAVAAALGRMGLADKALELLQVAKDAPGQDADTRLFDLTQDDLETRAVDTPITPTLSAQQQSDVDGVVVNLT